MYTVHCTKNLLERVKLAPQEPTLQPTATLGNWYAKPLFWKPHYVLFTSELIFLPVLVPLAPSKGLFDRFKDYLMVTLMAHDVADGWVNQEIAAMGTASVAKTVNRSALGVLGEQELFAKIAYRERGLDNPVAIALRVAHVPLGPLRSGSHSPDRALQQLVAETDSLTAPNSRPLASIHQLFPKP